MIFPQISLVVFIPKPGTDTRAMSRSSSDRTFVVVNNRPVDIKGFTKVILPPQLLKKQNKTKTHEKHK